MNTFRVLASLCAGVALASSVTAFADDNNAGGQPPYATYTVQVKCNPVLSKVQPVQLPITKDHVAFRIVNHTRGPIYFVNEGTSTSTSSADNSQSSDKQDYIPVVSENTVTVPYSPTENPEYKVVDEDGNTLIKWTLNYPTVPPVTLASATPEQFNKWEQDIQGVLENTRNRTVPEDPSLQKSEPVYNDSPSSSNHQESHSHSTVRGYW